MEDNEPDVRDILIKTAVKFLRNPRVSKTPLVQRQEFLRKKGLTEKEISVAINEASKSLNTASSLDDGQFYQAINASGQNITHVHWLYRIKDILNNLIIFAASCYSVHWFYKNVISPLLFGKKDPPKDPLIDLDKNIQSVQQSVNQVKNDVQLLTQSQSVESVPQLVRELKQDMVSLKALLLSRKQFPSAPPSIPAWQLENPNQGAEKNTEREDDAGSGSSTNNSDSSLEMIREEPKD
ncbi:peroxisomal membrane protein PEX14 [Trichogramma pretiosum]|uniref:Peroxisomal membrane protein PEX14 n=1 Tax=Trichogramma kaykai TaxID=54128 RepID=A0ABD2WLV7_9HYME|nr:peroxisomal membrane protein PEX14 [Trichogramma pretiosum]